MINLSEIVTEVISQGGSLSPTEVAQRVADAVPEGDVREALAIALIPYVRDHYRNRRQNNPIIAGDQNWRPPKEKASKPATRSGKLEAIRAWEQDRLNDVVTVEGGQKHLGDCTYDDIMYLAEERERIAMDNSFKAKQYHELASRMRQANVDTVKDLMT